MPDVPRDPRVPPKSQCWGSQEPPDTASIYFLDNSPHTRKNVVSEFGRCVLPPLSVEINAFVIHNTAKMTITHFFYNDWTEPIDKASYAFPVPSGCTLARFSYRIGDNETVHAVVQPAAQAREKFARAVREKRTAVLLEQDQDSSEIITAHLGNIPGETEIRTDFELVLLLDRRIDLEEDTWESVTTLTIPATMASRYGGSVVESKQGLSRMPGGVSIKVEVVQSPELQDLALRSPSHNIDPQMRPRNQEAQSPLDLQSGAPTTKDDSHSTLEIILDDKGRFLDKDFVLEIRSMPEAEGPKAQAWLGQHTDPGLPKQQALMIHIPPLAISSANWKRDGESKGEIVFLLDQSNSMDDKIGPLMQATRFLLLNIPHGWKFNICLFGSTYKTLWPSSRETHDTNLDEALEWLKERCQGNRGGSEVINALKAVLKNVSCPTQVLLLTDGQVWRLEQTLELMKTTRRKSRHLIRFFCLGLGDMTSRALIEGITNCGGGYSDVIYFKDPRWREKLVNMLASLLVVHVNPIRVLLDGKVMPDTALQSPSILSSLNVLQEESIFLLIDSHHTQNIKSVTVFFASGEGEEIEIDISVRVLDKLEKNDTTIHKLAARALLDDLKHERSAFHVEPDVPDREQRINKWAEEIACGWKLLSKWTNFIMPDQQDGDRPLMPFTSSSALMQKRLLNRTPQDDSHLDEAPEGSSEEDSTTSSSEECIDDGGVGYAGREPWLPTGPPPPPPVMMPPAPRTPAPPTEVVDKEPIIRGVSPSQIAKVVQEELDKREKEQETRKRERADVEEKYKLRLEREVTGRREAEEYARRVEGRKRWEEEQHSRAAEEERARYALENAKRAAEEERVRRETEKRAAERDRLEEERRARDEELLARKEVETRRALQTNFERLAKMIAELEERIKRKEAVDREIAMKQAEERARRSEEALTRTEWEREKKILEREIREAAEADAERRLSEMTAQNGQWLGHGRPVQGHLQEEATPHTGQGSNRGRAGTRRAGHERIWRLGVLIQDSMGQWELNGAMARIGDLVPSDGTQTSGTLLVLALLTVAGIAVLAMTLVFFFVISFMFLSSSIIALWILRI